MDKEECKIDKDGERWTLSGSNVLLHRPNGLPAVVDARGGECYFEYGQRHRKNGPALVYFLDKIKVEEYWVRGRKLAVYHVTEDGKRTRKLNQ